MNEERCDLVSVATQTYEHEDSPSESDIEEQRERQNKVCRLLTHVRSNRQEILREIFELVVTFSVILTGLIWYMHK